MRTTAAHVAPGSVSFTEVPEASCSQLLNRDVKPRAQVQTRVPCRREPPWVQALGAPRAQAPPTQKFSYGNELLWVLDATQPVVLNFCVKWFTAWTWATALLKYLLK